MEIVIIVVAVQDPPGLRNGLIRPCFWAVSLSYSFKLVAMFLFRRTYEQEDPRRQHFRTFAGRDGIHQIGLSLSNVLLWHI
jgi:hypothetical protein